MASTTEQSRKPQVSIGGKPVSGWIVLTGVLAVSILLLRMFGSEQVLPTVLTDNFRFTDWVNQAEAYLKDNYRWLTRAISDAILNVLERIEFFLWTAPWIGVVAAFALPGLAFGGLRLFILCILGVMMWGAFRMWDDAMSTLAMMIVAVSICIVLGEMRFWQPRSWSLR